MFAQALKILLHEALDNQAKVAGAVERLKSCKAVVIDVGAIDRVEGR